MFVYSFRASSLKAVLTLSVAVVILAALILTVPSYGAIDADADADQISYTGIKNAEDAAEFLKQFGWEVGALIESAEIKVPSDFDKIFTEYNEIQKRQGLDLGKYRRKTVTRYTFEVSNFEGATGKVLASVIVYKGNVIAGDLCQSGANGFVVGFDGK
ncbi:MAG: DUF4830 domain-containing protein [Clostridia bacterium]|nr:DUF4830 domain-containing protein [Clostridia bacterium]